MPPGSDTVAGWTTAGWTGELSDRPGATEIDPAAVVQRLGAQQLWIRDLADPSCLRACTHICTTVDELEHLTHALNQEANPC